MINMPFGFTTFFNFVSMFLDPKTKAKITMNATDFKKALKDEITEENMPVSLGGTFALYNEPYEFDLSPSGPFYHVPPPPPVLPVTPTNEQHAADTWRDAGEDHAEANETSGGADDSAVGPETGEGQVAAAMAMETPVVTETAKA